MGQKRSEATRAGSATPRKKRNIARQQEERAVSKAASVFLSYASADRELADKLCEELVQQGISVWSEAGELGTERSRQIEAAIRSADDILVLVGSQSADDAEQQFTWRLALEAVWQNPRKRMIPILHQGADLPPFVQSDSSGGQTLAIRIEDFPDLHSTAKAILLALWKEGSGPSAVNSSSERTLSLE
ncbi:MAG TPA: toll/interleukin-1 receptor domain-containing protein, partial [Thermoanaerobaculia bacterium]